MTAAVLGFGGNLGDPRELFAAALRRLAANSDIRIEAVSSLYETPPWGKTDQPAFLNAAARVETALTPRGLLATILGVERALGRSRGERWGPRSIDIDILLYGKEAVDEPGLRIPHRHLHERAFALAPLLEIAPDAALAGRPAAEWLARADRSGMRPVAAPGWHLGGE